MSRLNDWLAQAAEALDLTPGPTISLDAASRKLRDLEGSIIELRAVLIDQAVDRRLTYEEAEGFDTARLNVYAATLQVLNDLRAVGIPAAELPTPRLLPPLPPAVVRVATSPSLNFGAIRRGGYGSPSLRRGQVSSFGADPTTIALVVGVALVALAAGYFASQFARAAAPETAMALDIAQAQVNAVDRMSAVWADYYLRVGQAIDAGVDPASIVPPEPVNPADLGGVSPLAHISGTVRNLGVALAAIGAVYVGWRIYSDSRK